MEGLDYTPPAVFGLVAFFSGVGVMFFVATELSLSFQDASPLVYATWLFYDAHGVGIVASLTAAGSSSSTTAPVSLLDSQGLTATKLFGEIIAATLPAAAGFGYTARRRPARLRHAVMDGAMITIGYWVAIVISFGYARQGSAALGLESSVMPDPSTTAMFLAIGYPFIFGGIGGVLYMIAAGRIKITGTNTVTG